MKHNMAQNNFCQNSPSDNISDNTLAFCSVCESEVEILSTTDAAKILEIDNQSLQEMIVASKIHGI